MTQTASGMASSGDYPEINAAKGNVLIIMNRWQLWTGKGVTG
jgi:hypothetical protein